MARKRILDPGFWSNEVLATLPPHARLLFQGLWNNADREGRLEDRPGRLRALIFPYEPEIPVADFLSLLKSHDFISKYEADGMKYIQIVNWHEYQKPHPRETPSIIPPEPGKGLPKVVQRRTLGKPRLPVSDPVSDPVSVRSTKDSSRAPKPARSPGPTFWNSGTEAFDDPRVQTLIRTRDPYSEPDPEFWSSLFDTFRNAKQTASKTVTLREIEEMFRRIAKVHHSAFYRAAAVYQEKYPNMPLNYFLGIATREGKNPEPIPAKSNGQDALNEEPKSTHSALRQWDEAKKAAESQTPEQHAEIAGMIQGLKTKLGLRQE